jgi:4-amino-4-deoxy-L-arabinose transferase-like glycosyltransferase
MSKRFFWPAVILLLAFMAAVQVLSIRQESQTWDEGFDIAAGYSYWKTGDFRINREHPPLGKYINALPLLILNPHLPLEHPSWEKTDNVAFGMEFLYHNRLPAATILLWARLMTILLTIGLGLALAVWARSRLGSATALFALLLFAFDPNLIAHGRYITSDVVVTLFMFLACITWANYLESGRRRYLVWAGISFGLAIVSKFSAFLLLPVFTVLFAVRWLQTYGASGFVRETWRGLKRYAASMMVVLALGAVVVAVVYAPEAKRLLPATRSVRAADPSIRMLYNEVDKTSTAGKAMAWASARLGLQAHSFPVAVAMVAAHNTRGHQAYLLGRISDFGWWYYFPVVFAVKTPTGVWLALLIALGLGIARLARGRFGDLIRSARAAPFAWYAVTLVPLVFFGGSLMTNINIGMRHLLPIYPFLFIALSAALWRSKWSFRRHAALLAGVLVAAESLHIYPYYLAFFNTPSGGPVNGPRYLVDSNIDWGQDAERLNRYARAHGVRNICICYFGNYEGWEPGINYHNMPKTYETAKREEMDCLAAISVTPLKGAYVPPEDFAWLRGLEPMERIGYSIYLYDFRKKSESTPAAK